MAPSHALATREGAAKRWTGVRTGQLLSREMGKSGCRRRHDRRKATSPAALCASRRGTPRGRRTCACAESSAREPGDPTIALPPGTVRAAWGRLRPHARDVRSWEVGLPHSTGEAVEQGRCAAAEMVEGRGQREGNAASTTRPGHRAGTGASSVLDRVRRFGPDRSDVRPERGAQCGSSARWDLCGGPPERAVPTATAVVCEGAGEALTGVRAGPGY